jgi:hypothetical protein
MAEHLLAELAMEEGIGNIQLMRRPLLRGDNGENRADHGRLHHWRKGFAKIDSGTL